MEQNTAVGPEINHLYWETEQSVAEIANRAGVSRRALYEMIEPVRAGAACTICGAELYYNNRSAKAAGVGRCQSCGHQQELGIEVTREEMGTMAADAAAWASAPLAAESNGMRERAVKLAGAAIAGVVVGAIATMLVRRRT